MMTRLFMGWRLAVVAPLFCGHVSADSMTVECQSCAECDWDGVDSGGRAGIGAGGNHTAAACLAGCLARLTCNHAALSSSGYCHLFETCNGQASTSSKAWTRWRRTSSPAPPPKPSPFPSKLPSHPRLRLQDVDLDRIRRLIASDTGAANLHTAVVKAGDEILKKDPVVYHHSGVEKSLLSTAREVVNRLYVLGLLYRLSHDTRYASRAAKEMVAVANFPDWNPAHFLDTSEMLHGLSIGYDWTYEALPAADKSVIEGAAERLGFQAYLGRAYPKNPWQRGNWNWNQVVNGGIVVGALAFGDAAASPSAAAAFGNATLALPNAFGSYAPVGAWPEGPGYWGYGTKYALAASDAMFSAMGSDQALVESTGFNETGLFCIYNSGPSEKKVYNWADCGLESCESDNMFFLARRFPSLQSLYGFFGRSVMRTSDPGLQLAGYTAAGSKEDLATLPTARLFESPEASVGFFRSRWNDESAAWVGFKGCMGTAAHGDLDGGSFVLEMGGQRWAIDLGGDSYGLPNYWSYSKADGKRFSYYRKSTRGHNTLTFGGYDGHPGPSGQDVHVFTKISSFNATNNFALIDMTHAYASQGLARCVRGIALIKDSKQLLVVDEFEFTNSAPPNITWALHTMAGVKVNGSVASLDQGGKTLHALVHAGAEGNKAAAVGFNSVEVRIPKPQNPSPGLRKLVVETTPAAADGRLVVSLSVNTIEKIPSVNPLSMWPSHGPLRNNVVV